MSSTKTHTYLRCPEEVAPCCFCQTTETLQIVLEDWGFIANLSYRVMCGKCGAQGPDDHTEKEAIKKWNSAGRAI